MKSIQMNDEEKKIYAMLVERAKPELKRYRRKVIIGSVMMFLAVLGLIIWYWVTSTVANSTSLLIGGLLYAFWGALLLTLGAVSSPSTLGLMSMTRLDGNPKLFAELMKARFSAIVGVDFIVVGFSIQAVAMLAFGS